MKNQSIKMISVLLFFAAVSACDEDKFFEVKRPQETQWVNTVTFDQGLVSAYWNMFYSSGGRGTWEMMEYASSGISQLLPETGTGAAWNEMYNRLFDQNFSHTNDMWRDFYAVISLCNAAIQLDIDNNGNAFNLNPNGSDYTDNYVRQIGEYYFLRALAYYRLSRVYSPPYDHGGANTGTYIPLKTKVPTSKEDIFAESLGTTEEVYNQIIADLQAAKAKLPSAYNSATMLPTYEAGRATKYAAATMLAKVYFIKGDYVNALPEATFVIDAAENENRFALEEPIEPFNKNVVTDVPRESILEFNSGDPTVSNSSMYMYWGWVISLQDRDADNFGRGTPGMSKSPTNQFTLSYWALDKMGWMTDPLNGDYTLSGAALQDLRYQQIYYHLLPYDPAGDPFIYETVTTHTKVDKPQIYIDKYFRGGPGDGRYSKFPILRLADVYIMRSWLRWESGNTSGAADDLNKVWNRANPTDLDKYSAGNITHDAILAEYLKEMAGEGWTLDFIIATQMPIPAGDRQGVAPIAPPYSQWKWAVPTAEVALNPDFQ